MLLCSIWTLRIHGFKLFVVGSYGVWGSCIKRVMHMLLFRLARGTPTVGLRAIPVFLSNPLTGAFIIGLLALLLSR